MTRFVLASASTGRLSVLRNAGIDPLVIVSGVDEEAIVAALPANAGPGEVTTTLAIAKATAVAESLDDDLGADCVIVGCDSMLHHRGALVGKPSSAHAARQQWYAMAGSDGELYTGQSVLRVCDGVVTHRVSEAASATVSFGTPSEQELDSYVRSGEPLRVAGAFTIDGLGGWFVESIRGDPSTVIGLSLPLTRRLLRDAELSLVDLMRDNPRR